MADDGDDRWGGLDDPMMVPRPISVPPKRPWWLATRSLVPAVALAVIWAGLFVVRLVAALTGGQNSAFFVGLLVLNGALVILYVPSIVHYTRHGGGPGANRP